MERCLHLFIGMVHKEVFPVQRDVKRYSDSGYARVEQMLGSADYDFRSFRCDRADEEIVYNVLVEEFLSGTTPRRIASTILRHLPFALSFRESRDVNLLWTRLIRSVSDPVPIGRNSISIEVRPRRRRLHDHCGFRISSYRYHPQRDWRRAHAPQIRDVF